jgi:serine protease Do
MGMAFAVVAVVALTACVPEGGGEGTNGADGGAVSDLQSVQGAAVQIEATGSFRNPDSDTNMETSEVGSGSGFIIDPSGIAVTNNHIVTGAASLNVHVGGEDQSYNAKLLGVSEFSDLAVIDIEGEGFEYLDWYEGEITPTLDVWSAGFPLGDPEYTATEGSISKAEADGETLWASVDSVVEHTATINPGNSGGPLVNEEGLAVGVNYATLEDANQYFAIARDEVGDTIETLRSGENVDYIGVNGVALPDDAGITLGVWVSSVESGSPADKAGLQPGDVIVTLDGVELGSEDSEGPMAQYCDVLRTNNADDTIDMEVFRIDTDEVLEGQLKGRELEVSVSGVTGDGSDTGGGTADSGPESSGFTEITDDSEALQVSVPNEWGDVNGSAWTLEGEEIGAAVSAAPDLEEFDESWEAPGMFFGASSVLAEEYDAEGYLDTIDYSDSCTFDSREPYEDTVYTGVSDLWVDCGETGTSVIVVSALNDDGSHLARVEVTVASDADGEAADEILNSFVAGDV